MLQAKRERLPASAAATATASTAAGAATTAAATTAATLTLLRFVDAQGTASHVLTVQRLDGTLCVRTRHFHEAEAAGAAGFAIVQDGDVGDGAMFREEIAKIIFSGLKGEITYV